MYGDLKKLSQTASVLLFYTTVRKIKYVSEMVLFQLDLLLVIIC